MQHIRDRVKETMALFAALDSDERQRAVGPVFTSAVSYQRDAQGTLDRLAEDMERTMAQIKRLESEKEFRVQKLVCGKICPEEGL
jgi:hypothetical protein